MSLSMKYLFAVALLAAAFEAVSAVWLNAPEVAGQIIAGAFAVVLLCCAWAMRVRGSFVAATLIALVLLIDVAGVAVYQKASWIDWALQLSFGAVGLVGLAAWVNVLRLRRAMATAGS